MCTPSSQRPPSVAPQSALALRHKLCTKHITANDPYAELADKFYPNKTSTSSFIKKYN